MPAHRHLAATSTGCW